MANMLERTFKNEALRFELTSYIDKQQNVWFRGKDVAEILGYSKPRNAIERHVSNDHKMLQLCCRPEMGRLQNITQGPEMGRLQNITKGPEMGRLQNITKGPEMGRLQNITKGPEMGRLQNITKGPEMGRLQNITKGPETGRLQNNTRGKYCTFIDEDGFYELVFSSKLEAAKKFREWVFSIVLPSIRKYGYYRLFGNLNNKMFKIENEEDLHCKVVQLIRNYYPNAIMIPGLGENQDTPDKRINSWKKGYQRGQTDLMILDYHKDYKRLCIEFKSPTNNYNISESQLKMKEKYRNNDYAFILSNDYDKISKLIHKYIWLVFEFLVKIVQEHSLIKKH